MQRVKTYFQRTAAFLLTAVMAFALQTTAEAADTSFSDVASDAWYADSVYWCQSNSIMDGTGSGAFSPNATMTRSMLATVLYRMAGSPAVTGSSLFTDVADGTWYSSAVTWAANQGYVTGYGDGLFGPSDSVTREQIAAILWRYDGSPQSDAGTAFADEGSISSYASAAVDWAQANGVINGRGQNLFYPRSGATRAEVATILMRYSQLSPATEPEEPEEPEVPEQPIEPGGWGDTSGENPTEPEEPNTPEEPTTPEEPEDPDTSEEPGTIPPNRYNSSAFSLDENGFLTYLGGTPSYVGVDVSSYQGRIDWDRVAAAGVDFAMIRTGYRGYTVGSIVQDSYFKYNIEGASQAGLDVGVYFFSQAVTEEEAREEAYQVLEWIDGYDITYPVVFDWERIKQSNSRTNTVDGATVTACAKAFCEVIADAGYLPMTYGNTSNVNSEIDLSQLQDYPFWLAHYTQGWTPTGFRYHYDMWQYTDSGQVDGIDGSVDLDICLTDWSNW